MRFSVRDIWGVVWVLGSAVLLLSLPFTQTKVRFDSIDSRIGLASKGEKHVGIHDCSRAPVMETRESNLWTESSRWMNGSSRAGKAVEILERFGRFQRPGSLLVDIGAGLQTLRGLTPKHINYKPVDIRERIENSGTTICDLNRHEFPFFGNRPIAAFTFLGSFEYILDKMTVLHLCRSRNAPILFHYQLGRFAHSESFKWVAPLDITAFKEASEIAGYTLHVFEHTQMDTLDIEDPKTMFYKGPLYLYLLPISEQHED